ncbi:MAG: glycosyltransferase family 4 protein [Rufibacter sp.]
MNKLRVLMLGWEDQPALNGGVGKACFHLAEALAKEVELTMIVPQAKEEVLEKQAEVLGLDSMDLASIKQAPSEKSLDRFATTHRVPANLLPYEDASYLLPLEEATIEESQPEVAVSALSAVSPEQEVSQQKPVHQPEIAFATGPKGTLNFEVIQFARFAARLASHKEFDVVYAHDWMTFLAGIEIKNQRRVPLVLHVHSLSFDRQVGQPWGWIYELEVKAMEAADAILAVSERTAQMITKRYGISAHKVKVVYNGFAGRMIPASKIEPKKQVTFLGRLVPQKGTLQFLKVAREVVRQDPEVKFVVAGHGPQLEDAKLQVQKMGIEEAVSFTGFLDSDAAVDLLRTSGVFCLPAVSEPFGLAALEATQAGLPVVLTNQTGAGEVLPKASITDPNDIDGMAEHILQLLQDNSLRQEMVEANQEALQNLTWEAAANMVHDVLTGVLPR